MQNFSFFPFVFLTDSTKVFSHKDYRLFAAANSFIQLRINVSCSTFICIFSRLPFQDNAGAAFCNIMRREQARLWDRVVFGANAIKKYMFLLHRRPSGWGTQIAKFTFTHKFKSCLEAHASSNVFRKDEHLKKVMSTLFYCSIHNWYT